MKFLNQHPKLRCIFIVPYVLFALIIACEELCVMNVLVATVPLFAVFTVLEKATVIKSNTSRFVSNLDLDILSVLISALVISHFF